MDNIIGNLVTVLLQGGPEVVAILLLFIFALLIDRKRLISAATKRDTRLDTIIDDYHKSSITLSEAMNSMRLVLYELRTKRWD